METTILQASYCQFVIFILLTASHNLGKLIAHVNDYLSSSEILEYAILKPA